MVSMRKLRLTGSLVLAGLMASPPDSSAAERYTPNTWRLAAGEAQPTATLEDAAWLVGAWDGECFGQRCEETWNRPSGGTMAGVYKLYDEGGVSFYELMILLVENDSLIMKIKHFNADFSAWEDKTAFVSFPLVKLEPDALHFHGLSFRRRDADYIDIWIALKRDGEVSEHHLIYQRAGAP
jgi:Domain of unknown function (DUF6265)